jgi:hypothetical protein
VRKPIKFDFKRSEKVPTPRLLNQSGLRRTLKLDDGITRFSKLWRRGNSVTLLQELVFETGNYQTLCIRHIADVTIEPSSGRPASRESGLPSPHMKRPGEDEEPSDDSSTPSGHLFRLL